jgi:two-component system sensor histidine kinase RpfC
VVVPHPRLAGGSPVLDPTRLERLRQLDDDDGFVADVIRDFIEDAEQLVGEIVQAANERDAEAFRDRAHALRSSAAYLGATAIFDLCLAWRQSTPEELAEHGVGYAVRLESAFEQLRAALHAVLAEHTQRVRAINQLH